VGVGVGGAGVSDGVALTALVFEGELDSVASTGGCVRAHPVISTIVSNIKELKIVVLERLK
jgi:hypothetical protein